MTRERVTRRRIIEAGGIAGVVGLSGCLRLTDSGGQSGGETPTGVDTETPTRTPTPTDARPTESDAGEETAAGDATYPPGVSADEVSSTLVLSHRQAVADASRTVNTQYMFEQRRARIGDAGMLVSGQRVPDSFVTDGQLYQRFRSESGPVYGYRDDVPREYDREALTGVGVLRALVEGCNFRPVGTQTVDGETNTLIEADTITDQRAVSGADNIQRYFRESEFPLELGSASGIVTQDGIIRELTAFLQGDGDSGEFLVRTTDIGSTTVSRPDWTDTAREREAQFEGRLVDDGAYIRVEQVAGQDLDAEMSINAFDGRDFYVGRFDGTTTAGTVLFLYKTDEETDFEASMLGVSKGSRPSSSPAGEWSDRAGWDLRVGPLSVVDDREVG